MSDEGGTGTVGAGDGSVELIDVLKRFGAVTAVDALNLQVHPGEFLSLLGPSGCGKTTTLRMLAGFEDPDEGQIRISGSAVQGVPPHKRDVNTVFQNYALFPHMTVSENVAYGLRQKKVDRGEIGRRVGEALEMVKMSKLANRKPREMSGGQQQRVALARALVNRPSLLLLDEPLGRAGPQAPRGDADRAEAPPVAGRDHVHLRHARPGRGAVDERPDRRDAGRPGRATRRPRHDLRPPRHGVRRRASSASRTSSRGRRATRAARWRATDGRSARTIGADRRARGRPGARRRPAGGDPGLGGAPRRRIRTRSRERWRASRTSAT